MGEPLVSNVNINANKNEVYATGSDLENATLTLFNGIKSVGLYSIHSNSFKIYNVQDNEQSSDFLISIYKDNFLPYSELISFNSVLLDIKKDYICKNVKLGAFDLGNNGHFTVGKNGDLNIRTLDLFISDNGITVDEDGMVSITSDTTIVMKNDKVNNGGQLNLKAETVVLSDNFEVEKGASLTISN